MSLQPFYDIAIVGAGPAGATLARLLDPRFKVLLVDKKSADTKIGSHKCCGGLLNPDAQKVIAQLGLTLPLHILEDPQIFSVHSIDLKKEISRHYQRMYVNFDRSYFDLWLCSLVPQTVTFLRESRVTAISQKSEHFTLQVLQNGQNLTTTARYVVGAEGANSLVRKSLFKTPIRKYLAIQESYLCPHTALPHFVCFFNEDITDSYGWINQKGNYLQMGAAFYPATANKDFESLRQYFIQKGYAFQSPAKREACMVCRPKNLKQIETGANNGFLIGEAAGFVSTSSLEGISFALQSALLLAEAFNHSQNPNKTYHKKAYALKKRMAFKLLKSIGIYTPPLRHIALKTGVHALKLKSNLPI